MAAQKARSAPGRNSRRTPPAISGPRCAANPRSALLIGGHMDSVPNGGWLDGCLNVLAGIEILRRINAQYNGKPPITVRLVDWADEEGARFGKSLFGSSACSGNLDMNEARGLVDKRRNQTARRAEKCRHRFRARERQRRGTQERRRVSRTAHRARPGVARPRSAARRGARHIRRRAPRHHLSRPGRALRQHADESPQRRLPRRRENEPRDLSHRRAQRQRRLHHRLLHDQTRHRHQRRRGMPHHARPTPSRRRRARENVAGSQSRQRKIRQGRQRKVRWERLWQIDPRPFNDELIAFATKPSAKPAANRIACPAARCTTPPKSRAPACRP